MFGENGPLPIIELNQDFLSPAFDVLQSVGRSVIAQAPQAQYSTLHTCT